MADQVQFILDRMTTSLRSAEELTIFNHTEVQSIVRKRTDFEYVLKRRQLAPSDFVGYLKYEMNLEKLREIRCQKFEESSISREDKDAVRNVKTCFARHVCYIFDRALRRFPSESALWSDYIAYLKKSNSNAILNTVLGRAIALFPKDENVWIEAAAHEMNTNNSAETARKLLQSALRVNKDSRKLWQRYFEVELWNMARISTRKKILKIEEAEEVLQKLRVVSAPLVVFKYAVAAIPDVEFAYELYDLAVEVSAEVAESIFNEMRKTLGDRSSLWAHAAVAEVGKRIRQVSMPSEPSADETASETTVPSSELLTKFAALSNIIISGMDLLNSGLDKFGVGVSEEIPKKSVKKKSKKQGDTDEEQDQLDITACTSADFYLFLEAFSKCMHVSIGAVSSVYASSFLDVKEGVGGNHVLAAFQVLDIALLAAKATLNRMVSFHTSSEAMKTFDCGCLKVLSQCRLEILLNFADYFSAMWAEAVAGSDKGSIDKKKKRKSSAIAVNDREDLSNSDISSPLQYVSNWLQQTSANHFEVCASSRSVTPAALSHLWLQTADAALGYCTTAIDKCESSVRATVNMDAPGSFWWSVRPRDTANEWLVTVLEDLSKTICETSSYHFSANSGRKSSISAISVISRAQSVLLRSSDLSHACSSKKFVARSLEAAITSRHINADDRMHWIQEYIKLGYGCLAGVAAMETAENTASGRAAYSWCIKTLDSMPGILHAHSGGSAEQTLMEMYDQVLDLEDIDQFILDKKNKNGKQLTAVEAIKMKFLDDILQRAMRDCPSDADLLERSADFYAAMGDHKRANHLRWKKNNANA